MTRLQDDLLNDFTEQKQVMVEQIELFDPLATSLRKKAASRLMPKALLIILEIVCFLCSAGMIALMVQMRHIAPFRSLSKLRYLHQLSDLSHLREAEYLSLSVYIFAGAIALLLFIAGAMLHYIMLKNNILRIARSNVMILTAQHLKRKASIEMLEQRHLLDLPSFAGPVSARAVMEPDPETADKDL